MNTVTYCRVVLALILLVPAGLILHGCDLLPAEERQAAVRALTSSEAGLVDADNEFGLNLFRAVSKDEGDENLFISPLSVSMALGMTLNGADGATYTAMQETLELNGLSQEEINESYRSLIALLRGLDPEVVFEIANSIWYRQGFAVEPDFLDVNRESFDSEVQELDFGDPGAPGVINGWVDEKTHGKIEEIVDQIDPLTMMFLINAIYFNGTWTYEFDEAATRDRPFTGVDGSQNDVPMMEQEADLAYFESEAFQAVDLPYGDSLYSMTVILPRAGQELDTIIETFDQESWDDWTSRFRATGVSLRMPRFKLEYEITLNEVLSSLGMEVAFDPMQADFTRINQNGGLYISAVKHKTFVELDEEGTEAAAVTSVEVGITSTDGGLVLMHVDRPFVFAIREQHSGTILFVGKVVSL